MPIYATPGDLANWMGTAPPANATQLLRAASRVVRRATGSAVYVINSDSLPTDETYLTALRDATCAQAASWAALGIDPIAGVAGAVAVPIPQSSSIGGGSVTYGAAAETAAARAAVVDHVSQEAHDILAEAGLIGQPWVSG